MMAGLLRAMARARDLLGELIAKRKRRDSPFSVWIG
jgi:hypothetical protein